MRSTDEQLQEILNRAEHVRERQVIRRRILADALASGVCVMLLIVVSVQLPQLVSIGQDHAMQRYGSLLLAAPYMGYVVVSVLAFALGICVTLLCAHWRRLKEKERRRT